MITGKIYDNITNETLPAANVFWGDASGSASSARSGTGTDIDGSYSIIDPVKTDYLTASYIGYKKITKQITGSNQVIDFYLDPDAINLPDVEIVAEKKKNNTLYFITGGIVAGILALYLVIRNGVNR